MEGCFLPRREDFYVYCFCEENVHRLMQAIHCSWSDCVAIFVSNRQKTVHFKCHGHGGVVWDYHVVCACRKDNEEWLVFDASAETLNFPEKLSVWLEKCFSKSIKASLQPMFRVVAADEFLTHFSSDRRHMIGTGKDFPSYPPIFIENEGHNLFTHFVTMDKDKGYGKVGNDLKLMLG